jgi:hypothetical protein
VVDFFGIITRHGIRRGTLTSVKDLTSAIRRFIGGTLGHPHRPHGRCAVAISPDGTWLATPAAATGRRGSSHGLLPGRPP